jgi:hypothetical protein
VGLAAVSDLYLHLAMLEAGSFLLCSGTWAVGVPGASLTEVHVLLQQVLDLQLDATQQGVACCYPATNVDPHLPPSNSGHFHATVFKRISSIS